MEYSRGPAQPAISEAKRKHREACKRHYDRKRQRAPTPPVDDAASEVGSEEEDLGMGGQPYLQTAYRSPYSVFSYQEVECIKEIVQEMLNESRQPQGGSSASAYALPVSAGLGVARQLLTHKDQIVSYISEFVKKDRLRYPYTLVQDEFAKTRRWYTMCTAAGVILHVCIAIAL